MKFQITGLHAAKGMLSDEPVVNPVWRLAEEVNLTTVPDGEKQLCYDQSKSSQLFLTRQNDQQRSHKYELTSTLLQTVEVLGVLYSASSPSQKLA